MFHGAANLSSKNIPTPNSRNDSKVDLNRLRNQINLQPKESSLRCGSNSISIRIQLSVPRNLDGQGDVSSSRELRRRLRGIDDCQALGVVLTIYELLAEDPERI